MRKVVQKPCFRLCDLLQLQHAPLNAREKVARESRAIKSPV